MALDWLPIGPSVVHRKARHYPEPTSGLVPISNAAPPTELIWLGSHPDRLPRRFLHPSAFAGAVQPLIDFRLLGVGWKPTYPDRVVRKALPTAAIPAFFFPWSAQPAIAKDLQWKPRYPDSLRRPVPPNVATGEPFLIAGSVLIGAVDCIHMVDQGYAAPDLIAESFSLADFLAETFTAGGFLAEEFCQDDTAGIGVTGILLIPVLSSDGQPLYSSDGQQIFVVQES